MYPACHDGRVRGRPDSLSAVTISLTDMSASCDFYEALGFDLRCGGPGEGFTSYRVGGWAVRPPATEGSIG
jgi:hypothetical protein